MMTARVDRLGTGDLATLWAEEAATPFHIGLAGLLDPGPLVDELYPWRASPGLALLTMVLFEFGDFPMMRKLLLGIRRRAEQHTIHRAATASP
jgi:hypothetical protein